MFGRRLVNTPVKPTAINPGWWVGSLAFSLLGAHASMRKAEQEGHNPRVAGILGFAGTFANMVATEVVFGGGIAGMIAGGLSYLAATAGREAYIGLKHGARYRRAWVRAAAAPWSFSPEPSDVAYRMMMMATYAATGYETNFGLTAPEANARYGRDQ